MTVTEFKKRSRARLRRWLRVNDYLGPQFDTRFHRGGAGSMISIRAIVRRVDNNEIHDVSEVSHYGFDNAEVEEWRRPDDLAGPSCVFKGL